MELDSALGPDDAAVGRNYCDVVAQVRIASSLSEVGVDAGEHFGGSGNVERLDSFEGDDDDPVHKNILRENLFGVNDQHPSFYVINHAWCHDGRCCPVVMDCEL